MMCVCNGGLVSRDEFALVVIDVQERLAAVMDDRDRVVRAVGRLLRAAALVDAPVIVTRQYPTGLGPTVPETERSLSAVESEGASVVRIDKTAFCCVREPSFLEALEAMGRRQVVLVGMETHICVLQTALALGAAGFEVHVGEDACCSRNLHDHALAIERLSHAGITISLAESVMYEAVGMAGTDEFRRLLEIVKGTFD